MADDNNNHSPLENRLLRGLPKNDFAEIGPHLEQLFLEIKYVIYEPNQPIPYIYFPVSAVCSLLSVMDDGIATEIATVGKEGMLGLPVFLGTDAMPVQSISQVPGEVFRLKTEVLKRVIKHQPALVDILLRYTQALFTQTAQSAACNRRHPIEERCSRWLLMTQDRVQSDSFFLTQEFLAQMLGVRRGTVNLAAGILQKAGLITYNRGIVTVLDRPGLESATCECYRIITDDYNRLFGDFL